MKNKKLLIFIILAFVLIVGIIIYSNAPKMKATNDNPNWNYKVMKDKNSSEELQGVLSQKNEKDKMEVVSFYIKKASSDKQVVTYTNEDVKAGFTEENYKNEKNPIFIEFPLGNALDEGTEYSLILKYKINGEVKIDEIKFK
ncbi:hypothetical protein [Kurthia massiliensis]|uniref:hypothetical protein n=1 Tax=Kurthia massiliensis TaxID=1033739 RepID=UPI00028801B0|nr:hypothetical protein [Kurthia massiliensis]